MHPSATLHPPWQPLRLLLIALLALTPGACAALSPRDPLNVQVAGIQPLQGEGPEARFPVKLRLQNPNEGAIDYSGVALDRSQRPTAGQWRQRPAWHGAALRRACSKYR